MHIAWPGTTLQVMGHQVPDPSSFYLYQSRRMAVLWPFD